MYPWPSRARFVWELIKIKAGQPKPPELDRNGKGGNRNAAHLKYKYNFQKEKILILHTQNTDLKKRKSDVVDDYTYYFHKDIASFSI